MKDFVVEDGLEGGNDLISNTNQISLLRAGKLSVDAF